MHSLDFLKEAVSLLHFAARVRLKKHRAWMLKFAKEGPFIHHPFGFVARYGSTFRYLRHTRGQQGRFRRVKILTNRFGCDFVLWPERGRHRWAIMPESFFINEYACSPLRQMWAICARRGAVLPGVRNRHAALHHEHARRRRGSDDPSN